ncbi:hypothetical protein [Actinorhabdospora filicis]|uniref:hypothetical protein n=1 Tax=Actinorhabdospora filicis TaxID=1785913 RepID=UPI00255327E1|nr:hypothetical protein [Actinorhabdospora filicis]
MPRSQWTAVAALALAVALLPLPAHAAEAADLRFTPERADRSLLDALDAALPNTSVSALLDGANRTGHACDAPVAALAASFCWNDADAATPGWMPQGVTTSADATGTPDYDGRETMIVSWYDTADGGATDKGVRLSFVDLTDPTAPRYRHVLLAEPVWRDGEATFEPVRVHAGGIAWYGDRLYVVDTWNGVRVFGLDHLWRVGADLPGAFGRQDDGTFQGRGYSYVLAQTAMYRHTATGDAPELRLSFISVDRGPEDALLLGEYADSPGAARLARLPLAADGLPREGEDGVARADGVWTPGLATAQGAVAVGDRFLLSVSDGDGDRDGGELAVWRPGEAPVVGFDVLPQGPESFSYWPSRDRVWSASEPPGRRYVYAFSPPS